MKKRLINGQKLAPQFRTKTITLRASDSPNAAGAELDTENRVIRGVSVSSDEPYERYYGTEILNHTPEAIDLSRVVNGASPLLYNHDRDALIGKVSNPQLRNGKLYVDMKFSQSEVGQQMLADLKDGILTECSIGYEVNKFEVDEGEETYTATRWTLYECSLVSIPADYSVGVGRATEEGGTEVEIETTPKKDVDTARIIENKDSQNSDHSQKREPQNMETPTAEQPQKVDATKEREEAVKIERKRVSDIQELARHFREKGLAGRKIDTSKAAEEHIAEGKSLGEFQTFVMRNEFKDVQPIQTPDTEDLNGRADEGDSPRIQVVGERARQSMATVGRAFVESKAYREQGTQRKRNFSVEIPNLTNFRATATTATITNFNGIVQLPEMVQLGVQQATVADLLAQGTTNLSAVPYLQEDTLTNAAATVAEGALKPEVTWDWSQVSAPVKKIAVISKVSDELFSDVPTIESYVNMRLRYMVEITEDSQLLLGDGTGSNITGIENTAGIQTQAKGVDSAPDAIRKAMTKIQSIGFFAPDGVVLHPNDWEGVQLLKDGNGQYLAGGPFYAPYGNGQFVMYYRFWGLPVVVTTSQTQGTALVGAFKLGAMIFRRTGLTIDSTNSNEDDFKKNLVALRAEERLALAVWRPKAFATVTGL